MDHRARGERGRGGHASTRQAGTLEARPEGIAWIAHNTHSLGATDRIEVELVFTAPDGTVRRERMTLGDAGR